MTEPARAGSLPGDHSATGIVSGPLNVLNLPALILRRPRAARASRRTRAADVAPVASLATELGLARVRHGWMRKSAKADLRVRDASLRGAPHHEVGEKKRCR